MKEKAVVKPRKKMSKLAKAEAISGYTFMLPTILGMTLFVIYPFIMSIYYCFTDFDGLSKPNWVGLKNFQYIFFHNPVFLTSIKATFLYVLYTVPGTLALGLALAVLLNKTIPGIRIFRTVYYLPCVVPGVASAVLWLFIYKSDYGLLNNMLAIFHIPAVHWLESSKTALGSVSAMKYWAVGGMMIIFLSGLQSVPAEVFEAADIDGASSIRKFFTITFPMITPIIFLQLIMGLIGGFQTFAEIAVMTKGGPEYTTQLLNYDIYQTAFGNNYFGRATAEVWVLFFIIMIFTVIVYRYSEGYVYYENDNFSK